MGKAKSMYYVVINALLSFEDDTDAAVRSGGGQL